MIRFIEIDGQIIEGERCFAYYDTVIGGFIGWPNAYVWNCFAEFKADYEANTGNMIQEVYPLQRFRDITPEWEECLK